MTHNVKFQHQPPGLLLMYGKALLPRRRIHTDNPQLPDVSAELLGASTGGDKLTRYRKVCGYAPRLAVPVTWPHVLAFPLHLRVLTDNRFPLPLLGLVHLRNRICQYRAIGVGEALDLRVSLGGKKHTSRGLEFDLITQAHSAGQLVWEENSTTLFRQPDKSASGHSKKQPRQLESYPDSQDIDVPESIGRQYAEVSGDRNPIHLYRITAKLFGFPLAIAHGMWSNAKVLGFLQQQAGWGGDSYTVNCNFKKPLFLPGKAKINWQTGEARCNFQLLNGSGDAPHLTGHIDWF